MIYRGTITVRIKPSFFETLTVHEYVGGRWEIAWSADVQTALRDFTYYRYGRRANIRPLLRYQAARKERKRAFYFIQ